MHQSEIEGLRLCLLRVLDASRGATANESVLHTRAREFGFLVGRPIIQREMRWLDNAGALSLTKLQPNGEDFLIGTANEMTGELCRGEVSISGVQKPGRS